MKIGIRWLVLFGLMSMNSLAHAQATLSSGTTQTTKNDGTQESKTGRIRGQVVSADTGMGLNKATLTLIPHEAQGRPRRVTAETNAEGKFEFREVTRGRYVLRANRVGDVSQAYGQKPENVLSEGTVLMVRGGEILSQST